jgi:glycosyltransferase involved in cell wall biosynthesis
VLKILFITADRYPPYRVDVKVLFGKEIKKKGHKIDWLLQSEKPLKTKNLTRYLGGKAFVGPSTNSQSLLNRVKSLLLGILNDFRIFKITNENNYNIIIVKDKFVAGLLALLASRIFHIKFVYWLSFPFPEDTFFRVKEKTVSVPFLYTLRGIFLHVLLYYIILPFCDHAFVQTEYMKEKISKNGIPVEKMTAIPMAVSIDDTVYYGHNYESTTPRIVYIGTLIKIRRMEFLLRSFKMLLEKVPNAKLFLVGGSEIKSDEDDLKSEALRLGISEAVIITGFIPQRDAWKYLKTAQVCVSPIYPSPSFDVGSPTKLIEYMAMGKASVANDHPEQRIVLSESKAGLCVPYDEKAFSYAMFFLIKNQHIANKMGILGRRYVEEKRNYIHTADIVENKLLKILLS